MSIVLFDDLERNHFLPLVYAKPFGEVLMGAFTFEKRWSLLLKKPCLSMATNVLQNILGELKLEADNTYINPRYIPTKALLKQVLSLKIGDFIFDNTQLVACRLKDNLLSLDGGSLYQKQWVLQSHAIAENTPVIKHLWDLYQLNHQVLQMDKTFFEEGMFHDPAVCTSANVQGNDLYVHKEAKIAPCYINTTTGPVVIDKGAEVMEGVCIRGPLYLGENSVLKMGAKIYGATTIGKYCKVGGEVGNSIIQDYSNKGHDGYLGNSIIGQWCNLGADTNSSNLKNNYSSVKVWDYQLEKNIDSGVQFLGLIMGDHSKSAINTQFNTGTVVGFSCNVFSSGFPPKYIPSFTWGGGLDSEVYDLTMAIKTAEKVMARREIDFTKQHQMLFENLYKDSKV